jgi:predicted DNA-binding protein (MmcQ/YjbR family)
MKRDPARALHLRAEYEGIESGWHMNKEQWNSVYLESDVPGEMIRGLVRHACDRVVAGLPARKPPRDD